MLQRVNEGEVLYQDVYYPLLPLPIYLGAAVTSVFGSQFHVLQGLFFVCFIASVWICDSIARALKLQTLARVFLILALVVWSSPAALDHVLSLYQPLATFFLLITLRLALAWCLKTEGGNREITMAAMAAGASFASKDQIGALALAALCLSVTAVAVHRKLPFAQLLKTGFAIVLVFAGTVIAMLVPVMIQGGFEQFAEYFVVEREAFVRTAQIPYLDGIKYFFILIGEGRLIEDPIVVAHYGMYLLAPLVTALLIAIWGRRYAERRQAAVLFAFSFAAAFAAYPRADVWHVLYVSAVFVISMIYAGDRLLRSPLSRTAVFSILTICLCVALADAMWAAGVRIVRLDYRPLRLPHFEYAMGPPEKIEVIKRDIERLQLAAETGPVFLLTDEAGFYYLITGIKNPTPFDYPLVASLGRDGESRMIETIQSQKNSWVCLRSYPEPLLRPARLEDYVRTHMQFAEPLEFCDLYRAIR